MVTSKGLNFDMVVLKPATGPNGQPIGSTTQFKELFLEDLIRTFYEAKAIKVYEDRVYQYEPHSQSVSEEYQPSPDFQIPGLNFTNSAVKFRQFFPKLNQKFHSSRLDLSANAAPTPNTATVRTTKINFSVIQVPAMHKYLAPEAETQVVQSMTDDNNATVSAGNASANAKQWTLEWSDACAAHIISPEDRTGLLEWAAEHARAPRANGQNVMPPNAHQIATHMPCSSYGDTVEETLKNMGGEGKVVSWQAIALNCAHNRCWVAKVECLDPYQIKGLDTPTPMVVLGLGENTGMKAAHKIPGFGWQVLHYTDHFNFQTTFGKKQLLSIKQVRKPGEPEPPREPSPTIEVQEVGQLVDPPPGLEHMGRARIGLGYRGGGGSSAGTNRFQPYDSSHASFKTHGHRGHGGGAGPSGGFGNDGALDY